MSKTTTPQTHEATVCASILDLSHVRSEPRAHVGRGRDHVGYDVTLPRAGNVLRIVAEDAEAPTVTVYTFTRNGLMLTDATFGSSVPRMAILAYVDTMTDLDTTGLVSR